MVRELRRLQACVIVAALWLSLSGLAHAAPGASALEHARKAFLEAYAVARTGDAAWRNWADELRDYPLYPYLQAAQLEHDVASGTASASDVRDYLHRYAGLIPARDLRRHYLRRLAKREEWKRFLGFYRPGMGDYLACYALRARLALGQSLDFERDLSGLWRDPWLPRPCNKVQIWAHKHGLLTPERLWQRIESAASARRAATIEWLARWLPHAEATVANRFVLALRQPLKAVGAAQRWRDTPRNRRAAMLAITQLARESSGKAVNVWPRLARHFEFSSYARNRILRTLALFRAYGFHADALEWLAALPDQAQTAATRAWRVRVALAAGDWQAALAGLDALAPGQAQGAAWRYLRARVLQEMGKQKKAQAVLEKLRLQSNYWGFLAADRLGRPYVICPREVSHDPGGLRATVLAYPGLARAFELFAVGMRRDARREWARAVDEHGARLLNKAAALAFRRGWYSRAIKAYSYGELLQRYRKRFPIAYRGLVGEAARKSGVDPVWIYASIRAESAWIPDAGSSAGARGLMQLMPATARYVARRHGMSAHGFADSPAVSILLGSYYLENLAERYDGSLWLASAAYNAGPGRLDDWLGARGKLPPDLFIATIPFTQTRHYVIRVLAYTVIYDWLLNGRPTRLLWRLRSATERGERNRARVVCPADAKSPGAARGPDRALGSGRQPAAGSNGAPE